MGRSQPQITIVPLNAPSQQYLTELASLFAEIAHQPISPDRVGSIIGSRDAIAHAAIANGRRDNHVVGFIVTRLSYGLDGRFGDIVGLAVHTDYQSAGLGRKLVEATIAEAKRQRIKALRAVTFERPVSFSKLLASMEFVPEGDTIVQLRLTP